MVPDLTHSGVVTFSTVYKFATFKIFKNKKKLNLPFVQSRPPIHLLHRIKSILCYEEQGPISYEMDHKFGKIVIFSKQYKILEIRKCYLMALVFTLDIPEKCAQAHKLILEYVLKLKKCNFS